MDDEQHSQFSPKQGLPIKFAQELELALPYLLGKARPSACEPKFNLCQEGINIFAIQKCTKLFVFQ